MTDHEPRDQFFTLSEDDNAVLARYYEEVNSHTDFKKDDVPKIIPNKILMNNDKLKQVQLVNGANFYEVQDCELDLSNQGAENQMAAFKRSMEDEDAEWELDEESPDFTGNPWVQEMLKQESVKAGLDESQFEVFQPGEKYDFVKDLHRLHKEDMGRTLEEKIVDTIPQFVFEDIKKPRNEQVALRKNSYNPLKSPEFLDFFEARNWYQYKKEMESTPNVGAGQSRYRKY